MLKSLCARRFSLLLTAAALTLCGLSKEAKADWLRPSQLTFNTAHTLDRGELEVGLLSPLQFGVSEGVQISIHPLLSLVGVPNLNIRWRPTPSTDKVAVGVNLGAVWSFLPEENLSSGTLVENSFQVLATVTVSWSISKQVMLSLGLGPSVEYDFLDLGVAAEIHGSLIWLLDSEQVLVFQGEGYVGLTGAAPRQSPVFQLMYGRACGATHVGVGVAVGDFALARAVDRSERWFVYPILDLWWRL